MNSIEQIMAKIDYLPPFPATVTKVMQMLRNPGVSPDEVAAVVKLDQAVTTNLLRLCNSSYYGLRRTIKNIREAVVFIGLSELQKIILLSGAYQYFENQQRGYENEQGELWRHVIATSFIALQINKIISVVDDDDAFIASLLHDIGKLLLSEFVMEYDAEIMTMMENTGVNFLEAEKKIIGFDHAEVGAKILEKWSFSPHILSAVKKHHNPLQPDDTDLDNIVRIADQIAMIMGFGTSIDGLAYPGFSEVCIRYNLKKEELEKIMAESLEEIKTIESEYGLTQEV